MLKYIKILVSILLISILVTHAEWAKVSVYLDSMNGWLIALVLFCMTIQFPISSLKWKRSLEIHKLDYSYLFLQKILCIGFFFNNFLPTSIGGDTYRVLKTMPGNGYRSSALSAVIIERAIGLSALLLIGMFSGIWLLRYEKIDIVSIYVILCASGVTIVILIFLLSRIRQFDRIKQRLSRIKKLEFVLLNLRYIRDGRRLLLEVILISIIFQFIAIYIIYLLFLSLGVEVLYEKCALIAAIAGLASMLPVSINGIGVVEGSFVVVATQLGIGYDQAIIVAIVLRVLVIPLSVICGLVYLLEEKLSGSGKR